MDNNLIKDCGLQLNYEDYLGHGECNNCIKCVCAKFAYCVFEKNFQIIEETIDKLTPNACSIALLEIVKITDNLEIIEKLIKKGANVNINININNYYLRKTALEGAFDFYTKTHLDNPNPLVIEKLLKSGANINYINSDGKKFFENKYFIDNDIELVKILFRYGVNSNEIKIFNDDKIFDLKLNWNSYMLLYCINYIENNNKTNYLFADNVQEIVENFNYKKSPSYYSNNFELVLENNHLDNIQNNIDYSLFRKIKIIEFSKNMRKHTTIALFLFGLGILDNYQYLSPTDYFFE